MIRRASAAILLAGLCASALTLAGLWAGAHISAQAPKRDLTIAVTDSGLGGLSIMAEAAARLKGAGCGRVSFVFVNALFSNDSGYNSLATRAEKIRVFDSALRGLEAACKPDLIFVACNTLSVLIPDTPFVKRTKIPVAGIVDAGVEMFAGAMRERKGAALLLFGTETTIAEDAHRRGLVRAGIPRGRIVVQACPELAGYIENGWKSEDTALLISSNVDEALARLPSRRPTVLAGLICTHYGYSMDLWRKAFEERGVKLAGILNPNEKMAEAIALAVRIRSDASRAQVSARAISMVEIDPAKKASLGEWLETSSPEVASALRHCEIRPDLFAWKSLVGK